MSRFLTTIVQLFLLVSTFYLLRLAIQDIKENGFQFSDPKHDSKLLEVSTKSPDPVDMWITLRRCDYNHKNIFPEIAACRLENVSRK